MLEAPKFFLKEIVPPVAFGVLAAIGTRWGIEHFGITAQTLFDAFGQHITNFDLPSFGLGAIAYEGVRLRNKGKRPLRRTQQL